MARRVTPAFGSLGDAIAHVVATAVHKVIESTAPHSQAVRTQATFDALDQAGHESHGLIGPLAQHVMDTGAVHPVLKPLLQALGAQDKTAGP